MPGTQLWIWNWISGGYNSCRAETRTDAIAQSKVIAGKTILVINEDTLHVGTPEELQQLDAAYW